MYVDAKDMADEEQEDGETKPIPNDEYINLTGKGKVWCDHLWFRSQIAVQSTQFQYNRDYFVGDFVTVEHRRFGLRQNKIQLIGMIESFDQNGRNLTPTFKEVQTGIFHMDFSTQRNRQNATAENFCDYLSRYHLQRHSRINYGQCFKLTANKLKLTITWR